VGEAVSRRRRLCRLSVRRGERVFLYRGQRCDLGLSKTRYFCFFFLVANYLGISNKEIPHKAFYFSYNDCNHYDYATLTMTLPVSTHHNSPRGSIYENPAQKRGFIVVIILCVLATVGMFCLIITLVICKNKRDRKKRAAKMDAEKAWNFPGRKGRYHKLEDEDEGEVWSVEMDDRRPTAYQGRYNEVC
jgi:hypothetical protein